MRLLNTLIIAAVVAVVAPALAYTPFSPAENVCPSCTQQKADVITTSNGQEVRGTIVAVNPDFYTMVRYTEARAIPRGEVQSVEWANGSKTAGVDSKDQIFLSNGTVLTGSIVDDKEKPAVLQLKSSYNGVTYVVFKDQVSKLYKGGLLN
jgi:hypothetical protein